MEANEQIFREIKAGIALKGLTLKEVGDRIGVSRSFIWQVAKGMSKTQRVRDAIAEALGRDPWADSRN
jgi:transcriptional regulator with XRE-family HTH domain